jgi:hypothetical protein
VEGGKQAIWGCGTGNKHKDNHTEAHVHESSKLKSPIHLKASGCRHSDTRQEFLAHKVVATENTPVLQTNSAVLRYNNFGKDPKKKTHPRSTLIISTL